MTLHGIEWVKDHVRSRVRDTRDLDRPRLGLSEQEVAAGIRPRGHLLVMAGLVGLSTDLTRRAEAAGTARPATPKEL
jgi:hypothetical protein